MSTAAPSGVRSAPAAGARVGPQAVVDVDLDAVRANTARLAAAAPGAAVMAVVKADGYGHGMVPSARAALDGGATWLGVALLEEALELRAAGVTAPVLAWLLAPGAPLVDSVRAGIDLAVSAAWGVEESARAAAAAGRPARLHLEADTGLTRGGATAAQWPELCAAAARAEADGRVRVVGVWSHLACADEPGHPSIARQTAAFTDAVAAAARAGLRPELRHLANSAATLTAPDTHFDLVRPGIAVYGLSPGPDVGPESALGLRPAMTLTARVSLAKRAAAGSGVSYGHRYTTSSDTTVAVVPVGYADGVPRAASGTGEVLLAGRRRRIAGTVCMDQFVVDVGDDPVAAGDEVVVFGPGDRGEPTAGDWARLLDTIAYEVVTRIGPRVARRYSGTSVPDPAGG